MWHGRLASESASRAAPHFFVRRAGACGTISHMPDEPDQGGPETIEPRRAAVRPRGRVSPDGEVLPIDEHVQRLFAGHKWGAVAICGRHGSGKSTALAHLAATLPDARSIQFIDDELLDLKQALARRQRVVFMAASRPKIASLGAVELVPWNQDDLIEYLLAKHKDRCASVMHRILADDSVNLGGIPELWAIVLDELAADVGLGTVRAALRRGIERLRPGNGWESGSSRACLLVLTGSPLPFEDTPSDRHGSTASKAAAPPRCAGHGPERTDRGDSVRRTVGARGLARKIAAGSCAGSRRARHGIA